MTARVYACICTHTHTQICVETDANHSGALKTDYTYCTGIVVVVASGGG